MGLTKIRDKDCVIVLILCGLICVHTAWAFGFLTSFFLLGSNRINFSYFVIFSTQNAQELANQDEIGYGMVRDGETHRFFMVGLKQLGILSSSIYHWFILTQCVWDFHRTFGYSVYNGSIEVFRNNDFAFLPAVVSRKWNIFGTSTFLVCLNVFHLWYYQAGKQADTKKTLLSNS